MSRENRNEAKIEKERQVTELIDELYFNHFNFLKAGNIDETKYEFAVLGFKKDLENTDLTATDYRRAMQRLEKTIHAGNINNGWNLPLPAVPIAVRRHNQTRQQNWFLAAREAGELANSFQNFLEARSLDSLPEDDLLVCLVLASVFNSGIWQSKVLISFLRSVGEKPHFTAQLVMGEPVVLRDVLVDAVNIHTVGDDNGSYLVHRCFPDTFTLCVLRSLSTSKHILSICELLKNATEKSILKNITYFCKKYGFITFKKITTLKKLCSAGLVYAEKVSDISSAIYEAAAGNTMTAELPSSYWGEFVGGGAVLENLEILRENIENDFTKNSSKKSLHTSSVSIVQSLNQLRSAFVVKNTKKKLTSMAVIEALSQINTQYWCEALHCLHAWLLKMLHPTRGLKVSSVRRYFSEVTSEWVFHTESADLASLDENDFAQIYRTILEAVTNDQRRNYKARCLQELHDFGVKHYNWPVLTEELCHHTRSSQYVNAGYISNQLYMRILAAIANDQQLDASQKASIKLMVILAYRTGLRVGELVKLRLCDVEDSSVRTIFIVNNKIGNNKSISARRKLPLLYLLHPDEFKLFNNWCGERSALAIYADEPLFPAKEITREPFNQQKLSRYVNSVMRSLCPHLNHTFHHFRHSCLSNFQFLVEREYEILSRLVNLDVRQLTALSQKVIAHPSCAIERYWALAQFAGHACPSTSFRNYLHFNQWILSLKIAAQTTSLSKELCKNILNYSSKKVTRRLMDNGSKVIFYSALNQHVTSLFPLNDIKQMPEPIDNNSLSIGVRRTTNIMTTYKVLEQYQDDISIETLSIRFNWPTEKIQRWVDVARAIANLKTREGGFRMVKEKTERISGNLLLPATLADHEEEKYLEETVCNLRDLVKNDKSALKNIHWALRYYLSHSLISNTGIGFTERAVFCRFVDCFIPVIKPEYWRVISGVGTSNTILTDKKYSTIREAEGIFMPCTLYLRHPKETSLIAKDNGFEKYTSQILRFFMHMTAIRMLSVDDVNPGYSILSEAVSDT
jgi:integrase